MSNDIMEDDIPAGVIENAAIEVRPSGLKEPPAEAKTRWIEGLSRSFRKQHTQAYESFSAALELDPDNPVFLRATGWALFQLRAYDTALPHFTRATEVEPGKAENWFALGRTQLQGRWEPEQAAASLSEAVRINPDYFEAWADLGAAYRNMSDYDRSIDAYKRALALEPDNDLAISQLAQNYLQTKQNREAEPLVRRLVEKYPGRTDFRTTLGQLLLYDGKLGEARAELERANGAQPNDAAILYYLSHTYTRLKLHDKALQTIREAIAIAPRKALYHAEEGHCLWEAGREREAQASYRKACELDRWNDNNHYMLGKISHDIGDYAAAIDAYERATLLDPDNDVMWNNLGVAYSAVDRKSDAENAYRRALEIKNDSGVIWQNLAEVCSEGGDYAGAAEAWRRINGSDWENARRQFDMIGIADDADPAKKPVVVSGTVDLKLTPSGEIKICEFNNLWTSGFTGYAKITGLNLRQAHVAPCYDEIEAGWKKKGLPWSGPHKPDQRADLTYMATSASAREDTPVYANSDPGFEAVCLYKDYMDLVVPEDARRFFPRSLVLPVTADAGFTAAELEKTFGGETLLVIKPSDGLQGKGVEIIKASELPARMAELAALYRSDPAGGGNFWNKNLHPNIVVQEYQPSAPVKAANGLKYNGTMRVAFTAVLGAGGKPQIHFHGAYWKLPTKDITAGDNADTIISVVHGELSGTANDAFTDRPISAAVSARDLRKAEKQLRECLKIMLPAAAAAPEKMFDDVSALLDSDEEWKRALGARLATHHLFGNIMTMTCPGAEALFREKIARNLSLYGQDSGTLLLERLKAVAANDNIKSVRDLTAASSLARYMIPTGP